MKGRISRAVIAIATMFALTGSALAYMSPAPYTWNPWDPNYNPAAIVHSGTIDTGNLIFGDFLGVSPVNPNAMSYGDSGVSVNWDDTWIGGLGNANTNGDALDGLWVQAFFLSGGWWDLGAAYDTVAVFTSQTNGPYLAEGLDYRVFGTNTLWGGAFTLQASITDVYLDGWRPHNRVEDANGNGWLSDDITGVFQLDAAYRYIKLVAWGAANPEVDAVAAVRVAVPEPTTLLLLGLGLAGLGFARKRLH